MGAHLMPVFVQVLIALATVIAATRLMGWLFRRISQPAVVGELLAGLLLGPSLLAAVAPELQTILIPPAAIPVLRRIAEFTVVLFLFLVGIELDVAALAKRARAALLISSTSIVVPFTLGAGLAAMLYPEMAGSGVSFPLFVLFIGVAMSVTAFPVLARILTAFGMQRTPLGLLALTTAAIDDVAAWCLLAVVTGLARADPGAGLQTTALSVGFVVAMILVVRPFVARVAANATAGPWLLVIGALVSAYITDAIGIHALFGAFLFGAFVPHESLSAAILERRLTSAVALLLPTFFALTGLRTSLSLVAADSAWLVTVGVLGVAFVGKFGGAYVASRVARLSHRDSVAVGALVNTRGLVELVVLNVGLELGVISPALFAMLVLMALVTTAATTPVLLALGFRPVLNTRKS
jgi:Kef-type K+ transport system membrane component KefB